MIMSLSISIISIANEYNITEKTDTSKITQADTLRGDSTYKSLLIDEVEVRGHNVRHEADKDVWAITDEMRKNTYDCFELIEKIPHFYYDKYNQTISYGQQSKVLLLIDGRDKGTTFTGNLANMRFSNIEVCYNPTGRYANYDVVINMISKEHWVGYDVSLSISGAKVRSTGNEDISGRGQFAYTLPKYDVAASVGYRHEGVVSQSTLELQENNNLTYLPLYDNSTIDKSRQNNGNAWVDMDFKLNKNHVVSLRYAHNLVDRNANTYSTIARYSSVDLTESLVNRDLVKDFDMYQNLISVYYMGKFGKWQLNSDFTTDIYHQNQLYEYSETDMVGSRTMNSSDRHSYTFNLSAAGNLGKYGNLDFGYEGYWRKYDTEQVGTANIAESNMSKNRLYGTWSRKLGKGFRLMLGLDGQLQNNSVKGYDDEDTQFLWSCNSSLSWNCQKYDRWSARISVHGITTYPTLLQKVALQNNTDAVVYTTGNPYLKSSTLQRITASVSWDPFTASLWLENEPNSIQSIYFSDGTRTCLTFDNIKKSLYNVSLSYGQNYKLWGGTFSPNLRIAIEGTKFDMPDRKYTASCFNVTMRLRYSYKDTQVHLYYENNNTKRAIANGVSQTGSDLWRIVYSRDFLKNRLSLSLTWVMPLRIGVKRYEYTEVTTPYYYSHTVTDNVWKHQNELTFSIRYRFAKGQRVRKLSHSQFSDKELND